MAWINLALNISMWIQSKGQTETCSQFNIGLYHRISDLLVRELSWIQNPYAGAYLEDFVQKHLQA